MTYVEFFTKDAIENICTSLLQVPERVILIGDSKKLMQRHAERYQSLFAQRGVAIEFVCKAVNKNSLQSVVDELTAILASYNDCVFDLTGGEDLYLVAMGMLFERNQTIQMHRINLRNNSLLDCDMDGITIAEHNMPMLTVAECICLNGGDIVFDDIRAGATRRWAWNEALQADIDALWEICRSDVREWNVQTSVFAAAERFCSGNEDPLVTEAPIPYLQDYLENMGSGYVIFKRIINGLFNAGLLTYVDCNERSFMVAYKNETVKHCLLKAGQVLEMKLFSAACAAKEADHSRTYHDVMTGVQLDWDGKIHTQGEAYDTENEVDVILMHGMTPVFVSCKNGAFTSEELYKLNAVAQKFGGKYAKKVLVATALDTACDAPDYLRQRAKDMNILLVENVQEMNEIQLDKTVRSFWK